jgi:hypothetical protein
MCVIPSNANVIRKIDAPLEVELSNSDYTNYLGAINFNLSRFSVGVEFEHPEDTDYIFPVVDGNYTLNFDIELNVTSLEKLLLTRGVFTRAKISTGDSQIWTAFGINFVRGDYVGAWSIKDIERVYNEPPIKGQENVTMSIILMGRGFPFGFLKPEETSFSITAHFVAE